MQPGRKWVRDVRSVRPCQAGEGGAEEAVGWQVGVFWNTWKGKTPQELSSPGDAERKRGQVARIPLWIINLRMPRMCRQSWETGSWKVPGRPRGCWPLRRGVQ